MRIAWFSPMPNNEGGASGVGRQFLLELARRGIKVDCYFPGDVSNIPEVLVQEGNLKFFCKSSSWEWNRWYSRNNYMAFLTGQFANLRCEMKLAEILLKQHQKEKYDLVFQFSHIEMHALKRFKKKLPPIVLYPTTQHAAELKWHMKETHLSRTSESPLTRWLVRLMLYVRASTQRRHIKYANYIIGQSKSFAQSMIDDFRLDSDKIPHIIHNPIDIDRYSPGPSLEKFTVDGRYTLVYVSRISVRKGAEMVVELSNRLSDLSDKVRILIIGDRSLWSDYRGILNEVNPEIVTYIRAMSTNELVGLYNSADALLVPSQYEPCGLVLGEALACGIPVVSSDKVGSSEEVNRAVCRLFPGGDIVAFEHSVRSLLDDLSTTNSTMLSNLARNEAERLFSSHVIGAKLFRILEDIMEMESQEGRVQMKVPREKMVVNG
jgi:glycosyltransferase involved in cell wall biosynthesis